MRFIIPLVSLLAAIFSCATDGFEIRPDSSLCSLGLCRFDQMTASIDRQGLNGRNILPVLALDTGNPLMWSTYGDLLAVEGKTAQAAAMYDHAVELGPAMTPVLMRTANFDFTHDRLDHGLRMARQILGQTEVFDEILFSYFKSSRLPMSRVLDVAVPAEKRPARSWISWLRANGSDSDLQDSWSWMERHQFADEKVAVDLTQTLWDRHSYVAAQRVWMEWLGDRAGDYRNPELLWNPRFELEPTGSPFDWAIHSLSSVQVVRENGLDIRFSGTENVSFDDVRQSVTLVPGRYRLTADFEANGLTTDKHPHIRILDTDRPAALNLATEPMENSHGRSTLRFDFVVPPGTVSLQIKIERNPSERYDNKIAGVLHVFALSLKPQ